MNAAPDRLKATVSRETLTRLEGYEALLRKWSGALNLVSRATLGDVWTRHFLDSAQLLDLAPVNARSWLDLGSGAGFPGLVIAILASDRDRHIEVSLVESDQRKCVFLRTVADSLGVRVQVIPSRIEALTPQAADVLSARALAPLPILLGYAARHLDTQGTALFPKGRAVHKELAAAERTWRFEVRQHPSRTDPEASILEIGAVCRVGE